MCLVFVLSPCMFGSPRAFYWFAHHCPIFRIPACTPGPSAPCTFVPRSSHLGNDIWTLQGKFSIRVLSCTFGASMTRTHTHKHTRSRIHMFWLAWHFSQALHGKSPIMPRRHHMWKFIDCYGITFLGVMRCRSHL